MFRYLSRNVVHCFITLWCACLITNPNISFSVRLNEYKNMKFSQNKSFVNGKTYLAYTCRFAFRHRHDIKHTSHSLCLIEQDLSQTRSVNGGRTSSYLSSNLFLQKPAMRSSSLAAIRKTNNALFVTNCAHQDSFKIFKSM